MTQPRPLFVIVDWDLHFETFESKRLVKSCSWVAMPNKHDGKSYRRLTRERDSLALYGAWSLIVQIASKCPVRGLLADLDGPLDSLDLEDKTGLPAKGFERALQFATGERIGWVKKVEDRQQIEALLAPVRQAKAGGTRKRPQIPADSEDSPQTPADNGHAPADSEDSPQSAETPADSRRFPQTPAPRGRAQADRTLPDSTQHGKTDTDSAPPAGVSARERVKSETWTFILGLFGKKNGHPNYEAQNELGQQIEAGALPLTAEQREVLAWHYGLAPDAKDIDLRARFGDPNKLAINILAAVSRAEAYAKKIGRTQKKAAAVVMPAGWREAMALEFPGAEIPDTWEEFQQLGASIRKAVLRRLEGGQP